MLCCLFMLILAISLILLVKEKKNPTLYLCKLTRVPVSPLTKIIWLGRKEILAHFRVFAVFENSSKALNSVPLNKGIKGISVLISIYKDKYFFCLPQAVTLGQTFYTCLQAFWRHYTHLNSK